MIYKFLEIFRRIHSQSRKSVTYVLKIFKENEDFKYFGIKVFNIFYALIYLLDEAIHIVKK